MKNNKNKAIILSVIAITTFMMLLIGATYAYFTAQGGESTSANLNVTTYTTDVFTFTTGDDIGIYADQSSFASGKGNATGGTFAKASLTANNKTNTATEHYYVYLNISNNSFTYSINESTPELILTVTDNAGNEVTNIEGLTHTAVTDGSGASVSGYDITNKSGLITLFNNREITASPSKEETWNIKLTFVNYNANQNGNAGKSMSAKVMIQKEMIPLHESCNDNKLACHVAKLYTGTQGANNIYYHDASLTNGAGDNSYRYAGASDQVNNYVCFGTNTTPCPENNLYRIIGVFGDKVKLIKSTSVGNKAWDSNNTNTWSNASLNTYLNDEFINTFDETIKGKIADTTWKVGGFSDNLQPAKTVYENEIKSSPSENKKIVLMYASDYGFAAAQSAWTTNLYDYDGEAIKSVNWMYMGLDEWTISRVADGSGGAFRVYNDGYVDTGHVSISSAVRPSFNLESAITYVSGSGSGASKSYQQFSINRKEISIYGRRNFRRN